MTIEELEREIRLRITQLEHYNISHNQAQRLVGIAFGEYKKMVGIVEGTELRLSVLENEK